MLNATGRDDLHDKHLNENNGSSQQTRFVQPLLSDSSSSPTGSWKGFRICNLGFPSTVQRSYAPAGYHLCAVTVMEDPPAGVKSLSAWRKGRGESSIACESESSFRENISTQETW